MLARRSDRSGGVQGGRRADVDNLAAVQQRFHACEGLTAIFGRQSHRALAVGIVKTRQLDRQRAPARCMPAPHAAAADNAYPSHGFPFLSTPRRAVGYSVVYGGLL